MFYMWIESWNKPLDGRAKTPLVFCSVYEMILNTTVKDNFTTNPVLNAQIWTKHKFLFIRHGLFSLLYLSCKTLMNLTVFSLGEESLKYAINHSELLEKFKFAVSTSAEGLLMYCLSHNATFTTRSLHHNLILVICFVCRKLRCQMEREKKVIVRLDFSPISH